MIYYNASEPMFLFGQLVSGSARPAAAAVRTMHNNNDYDKRIGVLCARCFSAF